MGNRERDRELGGIGGVALGGTEGDCDQNTLYAHMKLVKKIKIFHQFKEHISKDLLNAMNVTWVKTE